MGWGAPFVLYNPAQLDAGYNYLGLAIIYPLNEKWSLDVNTKIYQYFATLNNFGKETHFDTKGTASLGTKLFYNLDGYSLSLGYEHLRNPNFNTTETYSVPSTDGGGRENQVTETNTLNIGGGYISFGIKVPF